MNDRGADALREHFDSTDLANAVDTASWDTNVDSDPMVVTSIRMPKSLLDWVREQAAAEQVKPTALIRQWIEDRRIGLGDPRHESSIARLADRVTRLEALAIRTASPESGDSGMTELLAALQASVAARAENSAGSSDEERRGA